MTLKEQYDKLNEDGALSDEEETNEDCEVCDDFEEENQLLRE